MCPACIATVALIAISVTSTGGLAALAVAKLHRKTGATKIEPATQIMGGQNGLLQTTGK